MSDLGTCTRCQQVFDIDLLCPCDECGRELCERCSTTDKTGEHQGCINCMELWGLEE